MLHSQEFLSVCCRTLFVLFTVFVSLSSQAQPHAQLTASRLSGPAPLAVMFDATGTSHSDEQIDTFRELGYYFDFDDPGSGVWETSGLSKNSEIGAPLAAHVFDSPGEYSVAVRAQDYYGLWSDARLTITVTDPDNRYAATNTVLLSMGDDFSHGPSDAESLGNLTSWPAFESGKRYLLSQGDDFSALGQLRLDDVSNFYIGSFGVSGVKPRVSSVLVFMDEDNAASPPEHGVIEGLDSGGIAQINMFHHLLIYNNTLDADGATISSCGAVSWYPLNQPGTSSLSDWRWCSGLFVVGNQIDMRNQADSRQNGIQGGGKWLAILGNRSTNAREHTARIFYSFKTVVGHNEFTGINPTGGRHALKMHALGVDQWTDMLFPSGTAPLHRPRSQYLRIHNNRLGNEASPNAWTFQLAPQDDGSSGTVEGLQDVVVEANEFILSSATRADMQSLGSSITERGNSRAVGVWVTDIYPSNYPNDESWHGPYFIDDQVPLVSAPEERQESPLEEGLEEEVEEPEVAPSGGSEPPATPSPAPVSEPATVAEPTPAPGGGCTVAHPKGFDPMLPSLLLLSLLWYHRRLIPGTLYLYRNRNFHL